TVPSVADGARIERNVLVALLPDLRPKGRLDRAPAEDEELSVRHGGDRRQQGAGVRTARAILAEEQLAIVHGAVQTGDVQAPRASEVESGAEHAAVLLAFRVGVLERGSGQN